MSTFIVAPVQGAVVARTRTALLIEPVAIGVSRTRAFGAVAVSVSSSRVHVANVIPHPYVAPVRVRTMTPASNGLGLGSYVPPAQRSGRRRRIVAFIQQ